jgi:predicted phage tail protein
MVFAVIAVMAVAPARADTEVDRLRDAVRSLTGQLRTSEDQRTQAQAKLAQTEREKALAVQATERMKAQVQEAQKALRDAVDEFNQRLAKRDETLEKWKAAYAEAAQVAQEKDALRAKFEGEAASFKSRSKSCEAKNLQLIKVNGDILAAYRDLTPIDAVLIKEPLIGFSRVDHQNRVQDFQDRIADQDARIPAAPAPQVGTEPAKPAEPARQQGGKQVRAKPDPARAEPGQAPNDGQKH